MKKFLLSFLALAFLAACNKKNNDLSLSSQPVASEEASNSNAKIDPHVNAMYTGNNQGYCQGPYPYNCCVLPEVIIYGRYQSTLQIAEAGDALEVRSAFNNKKMESLLKQLPFSYQQKLKSGKYYLAVSAENESSICFIAGRSAKVSSSNMEFAFQLKK